MEQELKDKADQQLGENTLVDMIMNGKQSIDDVIGPVPSSPGMDYGTNFQDLEKELKNFEKIYTGEPDTKKSKKVEGALPSFLGKMSKKLFGGYETEIIPGKAGLLQEGTDIYENAVGSLKEATKQLPDIKRGIRMQENYKVKLEKYLKQHSNIFFTCDSKIKNINGLVKEFEEKYNNPEATIDEKRVIKGYITNLQNKATQTNQTMLNVETRGLVYNKNLQYVTQQADINNKQLSLLESRISMNQANLEGFKLQIDTLPVTYGMIKATKALNEATKRVSEETIKMHETYQKTAEISQQMLTENPDMHVYQDGMIGDLTTQNESFSEVKKLNNDELYNSAKAMFLGLD